MVHKAKKCRWRSGKGMPGSYEDIIEYIRKNPDREIHIGSDSQNVGDHYVFATVVCLYSHGSGAKYFVKKETSPLKRYQNLGSRLHHEVELSISLADKIRYDVGQKNITVHADVSQNPVHKSSRHTTSLRNFIRSMGFSCLVKPDSWASFVADKHAK